MIGLDGARFVHGGRRSFSALTQLRELVQVYQAAMPNGYYSQARQTSQAEVKKKQHMGRTSSESLPGVDLRPPSESNIESWWS